MWSVRFGRFISRIQKAIGPPLGAGQTVKFSNLKHDSTVVLDLVKIKGEWKINNITWTPHEAPNSLRALLAHQ